jgi:formate-dependent phosphoribosylglycinamide formyltransferase (GAR transformylase)
MTEGVNSRKKLRPEVLLATTCRWLPTARLAMALTRAGCTVSSVCPSNHPLSNTRAVQQIHTYNGLAPLMSFKAAITAAKPDFIIPCDDLATWHLHALHYKYRNRVPEGHPLCALIEHSLGGPEGFPIVFARAAFMELAREEGVRVPKTAVVSSIEDLKVWLTDAGFPTVLKANNTSGGAGVRIIHNLEQAQQAFRRLQAPPLLARAAKRALLDRDMTLVWPSLSRRAFTVNAQAFVAGREATSAVACWQGRVLASMHFVVVAKVASTGHATVLRLIENADMLAAAEKIARRLKYSGLLGLDFMLETDTENAYLIEINPRATQVGHLTLGCGRDLPAALHSAISGEPLQPMPKTTGNDVIALFPQEWLRDSSSAFLRSAHHDVPWDEPEFVRICITNRQRRQGSTSMQAWAQNFSAARLPRL